MKLRHTAGLALLGWYLLLPPPSVTPEQLKGGDVSYLGNWLHFWSFDTAKECEQQKSQEMEGNKAKGNEAGVQGFLFARCIATDDPRLKSETK